MDRKKHYLKHWHIVAMFLMVFDVFATHISYLGALWLRFDCRYAQIPEGYLKAFIYFVPIYSLVCIAVFWKFKLYKSLWQFASYTEFLRVVRAISIIFVIHLVGITITCKLIPDEYDRMPISYYLWGIISHFFLTLMVRFSYRFKLFIKRRSDIIGNNFSHVMLIGAGAAGQAILKDINYAKEVHDKVMCIIDDNENKWGRTLDGVDIVGGRDEIMASVKKYGIKKIYFAIPSATASERREILTICNETNCELKQLPGIYQFMIGEITVSKMKEVSVEDLLGREPIKADMQEVFKFINDKIVVVTGGGGSIGSELCRQVARHNPKKLIVFDIYENNVYDIQLELKEKYPKLDLVTVIGSVRDSKRVLNLFRQYKPDIVYHAAAHKHVPLMEDSPCEAIKNNVFGTYKTAYAAMISGCQRFVLISTDKAVNPTNIMGASKRLCEMIIQSFNKKIKEGKVNEIPQLFMHYGFDEESDNEIIFNGLKPKIETKTEFVAVRFGNVLGSNGSVIPIFKKQIENGGPVTVTHPDIIRYFMTIPEAVSLVMLAGTYAHGGEIFVLDMGSPVKIDTLARNLIKLCGYKPDVDIKIEYTGLRAGEKLYEEKLMDAEGLEKTKNSLIHIGKPIKIDINKFFIQLKRLMIEAYVNRQDIKQEVAKIVDTYKISDKMDDQGLDMKNMKINKHDKKEVMI